MFFKDRKMHIFAAYLLFCLIYKERRMFKHSVVLIICVYSFAANAEQILRLNTVTNLPLHSPEHTGFLDKVAGQMMEDNGYRLQTVQLPAERGLINSNAGLEDGEMIRVAGMEKFYPNLIPIPEKLIDMEFAVFSKQAIDLKKGWKALENKTVAFINGWKILEINIPKTAEITKVKTPKQLFTLLKQGRTDYIIYSKWSGLYLLDKMGMHEVKQQQPLLAKKGMFMYLHKKHKKLIPGLTKALVAMKKDGRYDRLAKKHLTVASEK